MGASFSPTIANIFLSITLFLATQPLKPPVLKRYIDDIFVIWPHSSDELNTFFTALHTFHPSLHFTSTHSQTQTYFLDITIFQARHISLHQHTRHENIPKTSINTYTTTPPTHENYTKVLFKVTASDTHAQTASLVTTIQQSH